VTPLKEAGAEVVVDSYGELEGFLVRLGVMARSQAAS
jgi:hypothetical protein